MRTIVLHVFEKCMLLTSLFRFPARVECRVCVHAVVFVLNGFSFSRGPRGFPLCHKACKSMKCRVEWSPFLFKLLYFRAICFCLYSLPDFLSLLLKRLCQAANTKKNVYRAGYKSNDAVVCVEARVWQQHCLSLSLCLLMIRFVCFCVCHLRGWVPI